MTGGRTLTLRDGVVDLDNHTVVRDGGIHHELTPLESKLLAYLAAHKGAVSPQVLLKQVWQYNSAVRSRTVGACVQRLRQKIEVSPGEPHHLLTRRGHGFELSVPPSPLEPAAAAPHRAPAQPGHPLGRQDVQRRIEGHFQRGVRVVTLTGPGGVGKTTCARAYAAALSEALFVDLSHARSSDQVVAEVAGSLGIDPAGSTLQQACEAVALGMRRRGVGLLVLDGAGAAGGLLGSFVAAWSRVCPVLLTAPLPLALAGEAVVRVPPLSGADALALFLNRAAVARPGFRPKPEEQETVERIVAALDGLPLALELAADRIAVLSTAQLLHRLEDRFRLLRSSRVSLEETVGLSLQLLTGAQADALEQASVFEGGFSLAGFEAIVQLPGGPEPMDALTEMVHAGLVRTTEHPGHGVRFHLLETVRAYVCKPVESAARSLATERFRRHFVERSRRDIAPMHGERANLLAALDLTLATGGPDEAVALALHLAVSWSLPAAFAAAAAERVAELVRSVDAPSPELLISLGRLYRRANLDKVAFLTFREALACAANPEQQSVSRLHIAQVVYKQGHPADALVWLDSAAPYVPAASAGVQGQLALRRAWCNKRLGRHQLGSRAAARAVTLFRQAHDLRGQARALALLGSYSENLVVAADHLRGALALAEELGDVAQVAACASNLGAVLGEVAGGSAEEARAMLVRALQTNRKWGAPVGDSSILVNLALQSAQPDARLHFDEALKVLHDQPHSALAHHARANLAELLFCGATLAETRVELGRLDLDRLDPSSRWQAAIVQVGLALLDGEAHRADGLLDDHHAFVQRLSEERGKWLVLRGRTRELLGHADEAEACRLAVADLIRDHGLGTQSAVARRLACWGAQRLPWRW
jgi:predicted ATPase/DNA-binding winged helix-turn-helix (wHTH) protein